MKDIVESGHNNGGTENSSNKQTEIQLDAQIRSGSAAASVRSTRGQSGTNVSNVLDEDSDNEDDGKDDTKQEKDSNAYWNLVQDKKSDNVVSGTRGDKSGSNEYVLQLQDIQNAMMAMVQDCQFVQQYFQPHQKSNERDHKSSL